MFATIINVIETIKTMVAIAFITGETPLRSIPQITIGSVFCFPTIKKVTRNSSKDRPKVSIDAPIKEGRISGNVTYLKVCALVAPRSMAASSMERSNPSSLEFIISITKGVQNRTWLIITVKSDLVNPIDEKKDRRATPSTIGGRVIGTSTENVTNFLNLKLYLVKAIEARLPIITDTTATTIPT